MSTTDTMPTEPQSTSGVGGIPQLCDVPQNLSQRRSEIRDHRDAGTTEKLETQRQQGRRDNRER